MNSNTSLSKNLINQIRQYARLQFSTDEVEILCGLDTETISTADDAAEAYLTGRLQAQADIRVALMQEVSEKRSVQAARTMMQLSDQSEPEYAEEN